MPAPRYAQIHQDAGPWMLPLGGCGQFGANLTLYGSAGCWIAVDCGMSLGERADGDSGMAVPDLDALSRLDIRLDALLVTHGHEDHIGAIPQLWRQLGCPILATPHAARLIAAKLDPDQNGPVIRQVTPLQPMNIGPFSVEWVPMTHSIPESQAIVLRVAGRTLFHTGDWKLDASPVVGGLTAISRLLALGREGVDVVIGDSTNATVAGSSLSEAVVARTLEAVIARCPQRVVVSCFASNLARLQSLVLAGLRHGRHAAVLGRSLERHLGAGRGGDLLDPAVRLLPPWELGFLPASAQLWLCTGSQGEPGSALEKVARGRHPALEIAAGDTLLLSSRVIPGNELAVQRLRNQYEALGVQVIDDETEAIHASGHPPQEDLRTLYGWLKPRHLVPVHGEVRHQQAHLALGQSLGLRGMVPANGDLISLAGLPQKVASTPTGLLGVDSGPQKAKTAAV